MWSFHYSSQCNSYMRSNWDFFLTEDFVELISCQMSRKSLGDNDFCTFRTTITICKVSNLLELMHQRDREGIRNKLFWSKSISVQNAKTKFEDQFSTNHESAHKKQAEVLRAEHETNSVRFGTCHRSINHPKISVGFNQILCEYRIWPYKIVVWQIWRQFIRRVSDKIRLEKLWSVSTSAYCMYYWTLLISMQPKKAYFFENESHFYLKSQDLVSLEISAVCMGAIV